MSSTRRTSTGRRTSSGTGSVTSKKPAAQQQGIMDRFLHGVMDVVEFMQDGVDEFFGAGHTSNDEILTAAKDGDLKKVQSILEGVDIKTAHLVDSHRCNILMYATTGGHLDVIEWLCEEYGFEMSVYMNALDAKGCSVLFMACMYGFSGIVEYLLNSKLLLQVQLKALDVAIMMNRIPCATMLLNDSRVQIDRENVRRILFMGNSSAVNELIRHPKIVGMLNTFDDYSGRTILMDTITEQKQIVFYNLIESENYVAHGHQDFSERGFTFLHHLVEQCHQATARKDPEEMRRLECICCSLVSSYELEGVVEAYKTKDHISQETPLDLAKRLHTDGDGIPTYMLHHIFPSEDWPDDHPDVEDHRNSDLGDSEPMSPYTKKRTSQKAANKNNAYENVDKDGPGRRSAAFTSGGRAGSVHKSSVPGKLNSHKLNQEVAGRHVDHVGEKEVKHLRGEDIGLLDAEADDRGTSDEEEFGRAVAA